MKRPSLHILMTTDAVGGVWSYSLDLIRGLSEYDVEVVLATMGPSPTASQRAEASQIATLTLLESPYRLEWMDDPWEDVDEAGEWLLRLEENYKPDIIHLNGYVHSALPWKAPVLVAAHSCVLSWWEAVKRKPVPPQWKTYREKVKLGLDMADCVVAPSHAMRQALIKNYDISREIELIYNGADPTCFREASVKQPYVLSSGRLWDEAKNVRALTDVALRLPWPVRIAGSPITPDGETLTFPNVTNLGCLPREMLRTEYAAAPIFALPAKYEPFGLSALEAALSGCCLVLGDISSLREIWEDAAILVDPWDEDELTSVLRRLIEDEPARTEMACRARSRAEKYMVHRMVDRYFARYMDMRASLPELIGSN